MATESQKRAVAKHRSKLQSLRFDFNLESESDRLILEKFNNLATNYKSKKDLLISLIKKEPLN